MYKKIEENKNEQPLKNLAAELDIINYRIKFNLETQMYELFEQVNESE